MIRISPKEAHEKMIAGYTYVDVRTPEEFAAGHPTGAFNVPIALSGAGSMSPNPHFLAVMRAHFTLDAKLIVGCAGGGRSMRAAQALEGAGFLSVVDQRAGFVGAKDAFGQIVELGWSRCDLPIESGEPEGRTYAALQR